jgi:BASS family bile acid:Na+ symporter
MRIIGVPISALSWLGRQGTKAVAALVVIGIFLPSVGAVLNPTS